MSKKADRNDDQPATLITVDNLAAAAQRLRAAIKKRRHNITIGNVSPETRSNRPQPSDGDAVSR